MFTQEHDLSVVTAVLPVASADHVIDVLHRDSTASMLLYKARGTTVRDRWYARWLPPVSPAKTVFQMLVPATAVDRVVSTVVTQGKLHLQATGAVFASRCEHAWLGSRFPRPCGGDDASAAHARAHGAAQNENPGEATQGRRGLRENLSLLCCVVGHEASDRVAKAAISAGAHGPIVYYVEGRGLRDRLGWLRITKETEMEALMVIADENDVEEIFDAMARAGELHMPGRGFMYRIGIDKGMFNLPGRLSHHHYAANMQQIINAIDHLQGHTHWRDQAVFDVGDGRSTGLDFLATPTRLENQICLASMVRRDDAQTLVDLLLDAGAPGLNLNFSRIASPDDPRADAASPARVSREYALVRCVTDRFAGQRICEAIEARAESQGLTDLCITTFAVPRVAAYVPGRRDFRKTG